jgi:hypothetical protein
MKKLQDEKEYQLALGKICIDEIRSKERKRRRR